MGIFRIYKGEDNKSHVEELAPRHPVLESPQAASRIFFKEFPPGTFLDWHPAPRRQIVIILSGQLEHGFGDGSRHMFGLGDVRLSKLDAVVMLHAPLVKQFDRGS